MNKHTRTHTHLHSHTNSSYGETFFMTFQQSLILFFVFLYTINAPTAITVYSVFVAVLAFLLSPAAPPYLLFVLQASVIFLLLASRVGGGLGFCRDI